MTIAKGSILGVKRSLTNPTSIAISGCFARITFRLVACGSSVVDHEKSRSITVFPIVFEFLLTKRENRIGNEFTNLLFDVFGSVLYSNSSSDLIDDFIGDSDFLKIKSF